jgi:16S rRNA (uracil1498-N3)-methyltransferase
VSVPRAYAPDATGIGVVALSPDESHHLARVLRARAGDELFVFNGAGREWRGVIESVAARRVTVRLEADVRPVAEPPVRVTLAVGLLKGDQMDAVVRDATALGTVVIAPVVTARTTVRLSAERRNGAVTRWRRIAVAAAKQSRRAVVPDVRPVGDVAAAVSDARADVVVIAVEPAAQGAAVDLAPLERSAARGATPASAILLVGPEGGWTEDELAWARAQGARRVSLGPRTLRAETTPTVALTALWERWGW